MRAHERLLKYVKIDTKSNDDSNICPSSSSQFELAGILANEMKELGVSNVRVDDNCYVYGEIPATPGREGEKVLGLIAHLDTAPVFSGANVNPRIIEKYDGKDIVLNEEKKLYLKPEVFPELKEYEGQDLIVTDGLTLLGADDKAGIAEILTVVERVFTEDISHPAIRIAFTPDEEIGRGADLFDVEGFGADYAYTVDGGALGELEYENFNAASAIITVKGNCIHPGDAKNKMKNACLIAMEFNSMLPAFETPSHTENYEGFYHLMNMKGDEEDAVLDYIIRDHNMELFLLKKDRVNKIAEYLNDVYGVGTVEVELKDSYYNMKEKILPHMWIVDKAKRAFVKNQVEPLTTPIRGGTDGARLSYMGLPCPNLSTGGHNFHGKFEYIPIQSMDKMVDVIISILEEPPV